MKINEIITEEVAGPKKCDITEEKCPECGGPMFSEMIMKEKKDACYYKVKSRYKVWPSAYASGALVKCRKKGASNWGTGGKKNEDISEEQIEENLRQWFKEKWVRFGPDGEIRGDCARGDDSEGKPKCLPQNKAYSLGKKGRASAASRKRREDPNPERSGKAINVNTKKKTNEEELEEKWSQKYKDSINCSNPKGFSQKAHCAGKQKNEELTVDEQFDIIEEMVNCLAESNAVDAEVIWEDFESIDDDELCAMSEDWQKVNRRDKTAGMSKKAVKAYRRENPGSKLQTAVTTKPSKLKPGSKAAKRRKSFCARMKGNKGPMKKPNGKPTNKALALRRWNC